MSGPIYKPMPPVPSCMSGPLIEPAPLVRQFDGGGVFQGAGNSHFTCANGSFHETTAIPGFGKNEGLDNGLSTHFDINDIKW